MVQWWPLFEPWPRSPRVRRAINVGFSVAAVAAVLILIIGPALTWLSIAIAATLCVTLVIMLIVERPRRRRRVENGEDERSD